MFGSLAFQSKIDVLTSVRLDREKYKGVKITKDIVQHEAFTAYKNNDCRGLVLSATGTGKSKLGIMTAQHCVMENPDATIVIGVPTERLRDENWRDEFKQWNAEDIWDKNVVRGCYVSLSKIEGEVIDLMICDEGHNLTELSATFFKKNTVKRVIILTATEPERSDKKQIIYDIAPVVFEYTLDEAVEDGLVSPFEIVILKKALSEEKDYMVTTKRGSARFSEASRYRFIDTTLERYQDTFKEKTQDLEISYWQSKDFKEHYDREEKALKAEVKINPAEFQDKDGIIDKELIQSTLDKRVMKSVGLTIGRYDQHTIYQKYAKAYDRLILNQRMLRMQFIYTLPTKINLAKQVLDLIYTDDKRILVFTAAKKVAEEICGKDRVFHSDSDTRKAKTAKNTAYDRFKSMLLNLLGVVKALNEGHNLPAVDDAIVEQMNAKELDIIQRIGRAIRLRFGHIAKIYVIIADDTVDVQWMQKALKNFDKSRIQEHVVDDQTDLAGLLQRIDEEIKLKYKK